MADQTLVPVGFRLPQAVLDRIDAFGESVSQQTPGLVMRRSDAIRVLLERSLVAAGFPPVEAPTKAETPTKAKAAKRKT